MHDTLEASLFGLVGWFGSGAVKPMCVNWRNGDEERHSREAERSVGGPE